MQDARNKVVELSQFGPARRSPGSRGRKLLDDVGDMAATRLAGALVRSLEKAGEALFKRASEPSSYEMYGLYMQAVELIRERTAGIESAFRQQFYQRFRKASRERRPEQAETSSLDASQLSLMEPDDLEESLAAHSIANAIHNSCGEEMFALGHRIGVLINEPELLSEDNPLGPEVIGEAILAALKEQDCGTKVKLLLVHSLKETLPAKVKEIYQEINRYLLEKGVLPTIRVGIRKSARAGEPAPGTTAAASGGGTAQPDLFALLQQLVGMAAAGTGSSAVLPTIGLPGGAASGEPAGTAGASPAAAGVAGTAGSGGPVVAGVVPVVMQTLTQLQRGQVTGLDATGLDPETIASGQVNVLRELRNTGVASSMAKVDAMTLDIVALVFDYILDDRRVPDAMKALIGRLQIPVLKVAMLDHSFFSQKSHPARKLLDMLAEVSTGWNEAEGHDSGLYRKVDELVQRILNEFDDQVDLFAQVLADFEAYLAEEKRRIDELTSRSAQLIYSREQSELAGIVAQDSVHSHLFGEPVPELIREFLHGPWQALLTVRYRESGEEGEGWKSALQTMDDLIWSARPKASAEERKKLVELLPGLLKRLDDGLRSLDTPSETRDAFFAGLVKCHAEAVRSGLKGVHAEGARIPPAVAEPRPAPQPAAPQSMDFEDIPVLTETVEVDPALLRDIAVLPISSHHGELEEITLSDVSWLAGGEPEADEYEAKIKRLKRGSWIEYQQDDGSTIRAKLAWISPLKGIYLFTNRLGERAMSINAEGLINKLREGRLHILDTAPLIDRAVDSLLTHLQKTA